MKRKNYAAIDIGSNAVRLLIKSTNAEQLPGVKGKLSKEQLVRVPLRLGEDSFTKGRIGKGKAERLVRLMKAFRQIMKIYDVSCYRACATSAMRDASNGRRIVKEIEKESGIRVEIIAGEEEARLVYGNHIEQIFEAGHNYIYVDVGGGSTEVDLIVEGQLRNSHSYNIGTVRMLSGTVRDEVRETLRADLDSLQEQYSPLTIIGSGGNINKLIRLAQDTALTRAPLEVSQLQGIYQRLQGLSVEQRIAEYGLKPDRADVIVPAAEIFLDVAQHSGAQQIIVPTIGLGDGIIDDLWNANQGVGN